MKEINVGLIGYGFMGKAHSHAHLDMAKFFATTKGVPVMKTVCDSDEKALKAAEKFGWESYETDWRKLIERDDLDVIDQLCVAVPDLKLVLAHPGGGKEDIRPLRAYSRKLTTPCGTEYGQSHRYDHECCYDASIFVGADIGS